jgi:hypothetical protein
MTTIAFLATKMASPPNPKHQPQSPFQHIRTPKVRKKMMPRALHMKPHETAEGYQYTSAKMSTFSFVVVRYSISNIASGAKYIWFSQAMQHSKWLSVYINGTNTAHITCNYTGKSQKIAFS